MCEGNWKVTQRGRSTRRQRAVKSHRTKIEGLCEAVLVLEAGA